MSMHSLAGLSSAIVLTVVLAACSGGHAPTAGTPATPTSAGGPIIGAIDHALDRAAAKVRTKDITFSADGKDITLSDGQGRTPGSQATITPNGDLIIDGKALPLTGAQRSDVLAYRARLIDVAQRGIEVGRQGAALGIHAASDALSMVFAGQSGDQIKGRVDAQAATVRQAASQLCARLPALRASQQKLAAAVPAFRPYATMNPKDIEDCRARARQDQN